MQKFCVIIPFDALDRGEVCKWEERNLKNFCRW